MNLHNDKELFKMAILSTAQDLGIKEIYVEKDYWVTFALFLLHQSEIGKEIVFKGGTALAKCHQLIQRFSEDIDLVLLQKEKISANQLKNKLKLISQIVGEILPEIEIIGLTNKKGQIRKTAHEYQKIYEGNFGQIRDFIVLETSWLGNYEPYTEEIIHCFITNMLIKQNQQEFIEKYQMNPFKMKVLSKNRTFCEKIMSLVRFSRTENPIYDLRNKIRHIYDLHQLLLDTSVQNFLESIEFENMLNKVGQDDLISFINHNEWLYEHPSTCLLFNAPEKTWKELSHTYQTSFKQLVIGNFPTEDEIIFSLKKIQFELEKIKWKID